MKETDTREEFINLRARGFSFEKISKELSVCKTTLVEWGKDFEEEISNLKALELEALFEKYYMLKEHRVQLFGGLLCRIHDELSKRDFSKVGTTQLMELMLKFSNQLKDEITEPELKSSSQIELSKEQRKFNEAIGAMD